MKRQGLVKAEKGLPGHFTAQETQTLEDTSQGLNAEQGKTSTQIFLIER